MIFAASIILAVLVGIGCAKSSSCMEIMGFICAGFIIFVLLLLLV